MARPKKREQLTPDVGSKFTSYYRAHKKEGLFPDDKTLLHDIIKALLKRLSRLDAKAKVSRKSRKVSLSRLIYHNIQMLMVAEESWEGRPTILQALSPEMGDFERGAYFGELLCEIADIEPPKEEHWKPAFHRQREILEVYLRREGFPERDALALRVSWLTQHGPVLDTRLKSIPCYCGYDAAFSLAHFSEKDLKRSEYIGGFVSRVLAKLHGTKKKSAIEFSKNDEPDRIQQWHPGSLSSLPLLEIESRINPPFPPFESPQQKPNF